MSDEPLRFEYRISRGLGYLLAVGSVFGVIVALGMAMSNPFAMSRWGWVSQFGIVLLYGAGAALTARWSFRAVWENAREPVHVELTEDTLKVPWLFGMGRIRETLVPLERVTKGFDSRIGDIESLSVRQAKKWTSVSRRFFANQNDFEAFRAALTERLEIRGVPIKRWEFRFSRPQFTLRFLLLATTLVCVGMGLIAWIGIPFGWSMLAAIVLWLLSQIGVCCLFFGNRWMRAFFGGAFAGIFVEAAAIILTSLDGSFGALVIDGIGPVYPFTALLSGPPMSYDRTRMVWAIIVGPLLSGVLLGGLTVAVLAMVRRRQRRKTRG